MFATYPKELAYFSRAFIFGFQINIRIIFQDINKKNFLFEIWLDLC